MAPPIPSSSSSSSCSCLFLLGVLLAAVAAITSASGPVDTAYSYSGATGADKWGSLSPKYKVCSSGKLQSPINIQKDTTVSNNNLKALARDYKSEVNATLINSGTSVGVTFEEDAGVLILEGKNFTLKQMHWHSPSEHTIDGEQFPAELHLVHKTVDGSISVVGILYQYGDNEDTLLSKMKDELSELEKDKCGSDEESHIPLGRLHTKDIRKSSRKYYRYIGSLTTPPCTQNVIWHVLGKVRSISREQVAALKAPLEPEFRNNARPVQLLYDRKVELCEDRN